MQEVYIAYLQLKFEKYNALLKYLLKKNENLKPLQLKKLSGSFSSCDVNKDDISFSFWQWGKEKIKMSNTCQQVEKAINQLFQEVDGQVKGMCQVNKEITEFDVNNFMHKLNDSIQGMLVGVTEYDFKKTLYIKLNIHVFRYVHPIFERHNEEYFRTNAMDVRLERYRVQQKISFEAHLSSRQSENIAAKLFSNVVETFADEWTSHNLPHKITDELFSVLPKVKSRVIIEICTDLLEKGDFKNFLKYIHRPKDFASAWIAEKANRHLFSEQNRRYDAIATLLSGNVFTNVAICVSALKNKYTTGSNPSMEMWIEDFQKQMKDNKLTIEIERFRTVKKEVKQIKNVEYFINEILAHLNESEEKLKHKFSQETAESVTWTGSNPIDSVISKSWGCPAQCPFCGEPCAKNNDHDGSVHCSIQHRPLCCRSCMQEGNNLATLESCEFHVQSNYIHNCSSFGYICNGGKKEECGKEHLFREYKKYFPDWDIRPSANMHETSKFWMWFVATYKNELRVYYDYKIDHIPESWYTISETEAKMSLECTYSV